MPKQREVSLKDQLKRVGIDVSEHLASYRGPPPAYTSPRVVKRGDVDKYKSEVPMKDKSGPEPLPKDVYVSQSQLPPPSVIFKKQELPVRTKSKVPLGEGKGDFKTSNQKEYKKFKTQSPNKQFMWERTKSNLPIQGGPHGAKMPVSTNMATYRPHKIEPLPPMDPKTRRLALIESKGTQWDDEEEEEEEGGAEDQDVPSLKASPLSSPNASPRRSPTTVLPAGGGGAGLYTPVLRGSVNKCHSTVDLGEARVPEGQPEPDYFVTTHQTAFTRPPGYVTHGEFHRTRSAWVPGVDPSSYKTTHVQEYTSGKDWNKKTTKYQWDRTKSQVPLVPPPTAPASVADGRVAEYRDAYQLGLESTDWRAPVLRGTVNKYTSLVELPHKGSGEGSLHFDTTHGEHYSAELLTATPRGGARFFDRTASRVPLAMPGTNGRPLQRDTTYSTSYDREQGTARPVRVLPLKTPCTVRLI